MPKDLKDCFESKEKYQEIDNNWSQTLHKDYIRASVEKEMEKYYPKDLDLNWRHYVPEGYQNYTEDISKAG